MRLEHNFVVPVPVEQAWQALLDVERVAPCMPGATLGEVHGEEFTGTVKVKLGPMALTYAGNATFTEKDADAHRVVISAAGKEKKGAGTAKATVTATLAEQGSQTAVHVITDFTITGRPAQFGRGVLQEVSNKLLDEFATRLSGQLSGATAGPAPAPAASTGDSRPAAGPAAGPSVAGNDAIDVFGVAGFPVLKRLAPAVLGLLALAAIAAILRRPALR
ncbi:MULTISPECIES: SRPBCC family protein [Amycolatopsis]|uniref:Carbon monoxide dehydrogenase subunit G n=1 Tax=Amycolatopsis methanolica 239 TaxID=1068978 RepID=A0A076MQS4_AMYME|nr:SRPBCC family protein [Amycolatopsis methanolica]AIJ21205.1 carbon monoxide dehydrogenase subunit G [Amycolatopsis methanolica 239]